MCRSRPEKDARLKALAAKKHMVDGKLSSIKGKGKLTQAKMLKYQKYYGKAIRSNVNDFVSMQSAVMATFYHSISVWNIVTCIAIAGQIVLFPW